MNNHYELVDFGGGRKLERIGGLLVDRPSPVATGPRQYAEFWSEAHASFQLREKHQGDWTFRASLPEPWTFSSWFGELILQPSPFGHLGVFCEQATIWNWLKAHQARLAGRQILNLFAYTGGTTLALAHLGASVTHVDSAANIVSRARQNAERSALSEKPIRWIVEDVLKYVQREIKRGRTYDGFVLDPPSYGHGAKKEIWKIEEDLPTLLELLAELCQNDCQVLAFSCHTQGYDSTHLDRLARDANLVTGGSLPQELKLQASDGRSLPSGHFVGFVRS